MIRADFITSIVLLVLGLGVAAQSWRMPRFLEGGSSIWSAPGVVPGMIGLALALMGGLLCLRTFWAPAGAAAAEAEGGGETGGGETGEGPGGWLRVLVAVLLSIGYAGLLVGSMPFWLASFLFVLAFILIFELAAAENRAHWLRRVAVAVAVAALISAAVSYIFEVIFLVRLP